MLAHPSYPCLTYFGPNPHAQDARKDASGNRFRLGIAAFPLKCGVIRVVTGIMGGGDIDPTLYRFFFRRVVSICLCSFVDRCLSEAWNL